MTLSGAPIQLAYLVRWLAARGWDLTVLAPEPGALANELGDAQTIFDSHLLADPARARFREVLPQFDLVAREHRRRLAGDLHRG